MNKLLLVCTLLVAALYMFKNDLTAFAQSSFADFSADNDFVEIHSPAVVDIQASPEQIMAVSDSGITLTEQIVITPQEVGAYSELRSQGVANGLASPVLKHSEQTVLNTVQSSFAEKSLFLYSFECKKNDCNAGIVATDGQPKHEDIAGVLALLSSAEEFANHSVQLAGVAVNNDGILQYDLNIKNNLPE